MAEKDDELGAAFDQPMPRLLAEMTGFEGTWREYFARDRRIPLDQLVVTRARGRGVHVQGGQAVDLGFQDAAGGRGFSPEDAERIRQALDRLRRTEG